MTQSAGNPYVGPRPYAESEWERFFGRERQAIDLLSLVLADRLVLFFAPSGAGKSSILNARLRRDLDERHFDVFPTARVSGQVPANVGEVDNIFVFDLISDLQAEQKDLSPFAHMTLSDYLSTHRPPVRDQTRDRLRPQVLIIDQFEEVFTSHPEAWDQRAAFFEQLGQAVEHEESVLRVVLAMREEKVAALDRYAHLLPGRLNTRFSMQRLDREAALRAIERPAEQAGRPFVRKVAEELRDNLSLVWARTDGRKQYPGEFVEPVQLQVVCWQLWEELKKYPGDSIERHHLEQIAGSSDLAHFVDSALARFYMDAIHDTAARKGVSEYKLRYWFDESLVTADRTRNQVYRGQHDTAGLRNEAVEWLSALLLIHEEPRPAGTWYELVHDRLIGPICDNNAAWREQNEIIPLVRKWELSHHSPDTLIGGALLARAETEDWACLGNEVQSFLAASRQEQRRRELEALKLREGELELLHAQERAQQAEAHRRRERRFIYAIAAALLLAIVAAVLAFQNWRIADADRAAVHYQQAMQLVTDGTGLDGIDIASALAAVQSPWLAFGGAESEYEQLARDVVMSVAGDKPLRPTPPQGVPETAVNWPLLTISPDGQWALMPINAAEGRAWCAGYLWHWEAGTTDRPQDQDCIASGGNALSRVAFNAGSNWLGLGYADGAVELVNLANRAQRLALPTRLSGDLVALSVDPDGRWLAVVDEVVEITGAQRTLRLWDAQDGNVTEAALETAATQIPSPLAFSSDGRWLAVGNRETVQLWNVHSQQTEPAYELPALPETVPPVVVSLVFAASEAPGLAPRLAVGYSNGAIDLYEENRQPAENTALDIPTPETPLPVNSVDSSGQTGLELTPIKHLQKHSPDSLTDLAFGGADGRSLAAASSMTIEIWHGDSLLPMLTTRPDTTIYRIDHTSTITSEITDFAHVVWRQMPGLWVVFDSQGGVRTYALQSSTRQDWKEVLREACKELEAASAEVGKEKAIAAEFSEARTRQVESLKMVCKRYWSRTANREAQ